MQRLDVSFFGVLFYRQYRAIRERIESIDSLKKREIKKQETVDETTGEKENKKGKMLRF